MPPAFKNKEFGVLPHTVPKRASMPWRPYSLATPRRSTFLAPCGGNVQSRRGSARRSGQRSVYGCASRSASFVLCPSALFLDVGPLPWPALLVGRSRGALRAARRGHHSVSGGATLLRFVDLARPATVHAVGPFPWPLCAGPSMAPRGFFAAPSMAPHGFIPLQPQPGPTRAPCFRRRPPKCTPPTGSAATSHGGRYPTRSVAAGSYAAKNPAHTVTPMPRQLVRPRAETASSFRGRGHRE